TLEIGLQHLDLAGLWLAHDDDGVDAGQHIERLLQKFDGSGAIEKGETLVEVARGRDIHLDAHLASARLGARVADRAALRHSAFSLHRTRDGQYAFQQRGLAAAIRPNHGHGAWTSAVFDLS